MRTWTERSEFKYTGSVETGTQIIYGKNKNRITVSAKSYRLLRQELLNQTVHIGTSRDNRPIGSLGYWLEKNVTRTAIASYVGPILIEERYAQKVGEHEIKIIR